MLVILLTVTRSERESTPMLLDELRDLRQATPFRDMTPVRETNEPSTTCKCALVNLMKRCSVLHVFIMVCAATLLCELICLFCCDAIIV